MKFFDYETRDDWGKDYYFSFLKTKKYTVIQISLMVGETVDPFYLQIRMGSGSFFEFLLCTWRLGFDVSVFGRTWRS